MTWRRSLQRWTCLIKGRNVSIPFACNWTATFFSKRTRVWIAYQEYSSAVGTGICAVSLIQFSCAVDMAPPIESHSNFSTSSFPASRCSRRVARPKGIEHMARGLASHLPLQHAINLLRYGKGAVVEHRPQYPYVCGFERLFSFTSCHPAGGICLQHKHYAVRPPAEYCRVAIQPNRRCVDDHIGKFGRQLFNLRSNLVERRCHSPVGGGQVTGNQPEIARDLLHGLSLRCGLQRTLAIGALYIE